MKQTSGAGDNRQIPTVIANTMRGHNASRVSEFSGKEIIGYLNFAPNSQAGMLGQIVINPILMTAPRLRNHVKNFSQFKFSKLRFAVRGDLPTTVSGSVYMGYSTNPDLDIPDTQAAPANLFSLGKSVIANLWSSTEFDCNLDMSQWFFVDPDSSEIMKTSQGKLFMASTGGFNITATYSVPLFVEYSVHCKGEQITPEANAGVVILPAMSLQATSSNPTLENGRLLTFTDTITIPGIIFGTSSGVAGDPWLIIPSMIVNTSESNSQQAQIAVFQKDVIGTNQRVYLYETFEAFQERDVIRSTVAQNFDRCTLEPYYEVTRRRLNPTRKVPGFSSLPAPVAMDVDLNSRG